jgi:stage II sporulation protein D
VADGPGGTTSPSRSYCRESPHFRWTEVWEGETEISDILQALAGEQGVAVERLGLLKDVRVDERGRSGRVRSTLFLTERAEIRVPGDRVRWVLRRPGGRGILRSTWFDLDVKRQNGTVNRIEAIGRGHGHGIGLCQWGAMGMAAEGRRFDEILRHYYPGTRLRPADRELLAETASVGR